VNGQVNISDVLDSTCTVYYMMYKSVESEPNRSQQSTLDWCCMCCHIKDKAMTAHHNAAALALTR